MKLEPDVTLIHLIMTKMLPPLIMMVSDGFRHLFTLDCLSLK
jgi:hypothetical protein